MKQNGKLTGNALTAALEKQTWDPSVKSLVNFPQVLTMMSEKLDWTQKLGDTILAQQPDVMDAVQRLRATYHQALLHPHACLCGAEGEDSALGVIVGAQP